MGYHCDETWSIPDVVVPECGLNLWLTVSYNDILCVMASCRFCKPSRC